MIKEKVCHYLPGDIGGGSIIKKVTNGDIGGGGYKVWHFRCDIIFEWSLNIFINSCLNAKTKLVQSFRKIIYLKTRKGI